MRLCGLSVCLPVRLSALLPNSLCPHLYAFLCMYKSTCFVCWGVILFVCFFVCVGGFVCLFGGGGGCCCCFWGFFVLFCWGFFVCLFGWLVVCFAFVRGALGV